MTAGLDSRLVLASSRNISDSVSFMTVREITMPEDHMDVKLPADLLSDLGLQHSVVKSSLILDDDFLETFKKNVTVPHYVYAPDAQVILETYALKKVVVTGSASEIARSTFRIDLNKSIDDIITAEDLARLQKMGDNRFMLHSFDDWLTDTGDLFNIDILDLFEWEQGHGNWLAMCQQEFDIAWKDIFTPYNCRNLIVNMLSVDAEFRKPPEYTLYKNLIMKLWPELLKIPINPQKSKIHNKTGLLSRVRYKVSPYVPDSVKNVLKKM